MQRFKRILFFTSFYLLTLQILAQSRISFRITDETIEINKVAVISQPGRNCDNSINDTQSVAELIEGELIGIYGVVERTNLERILDEQRLAMSGLLLEESDIAEAGCLSGANGTIIVTFGCIDDKPKLQIKLVDCSTADLYWSATGIDVSVLELMEKVREGLLNKKEVFVNETNLDNNIVENSFQRLDGIVAVVGNEIILSSELDEMILQERMQGKGIGPNQKCQLFEDMLFEKLLLHHARVDSLEVTDAEVMDEIDRRLAYYINMLGSIEAFEAEYGKSVTQWKDDFGKPIKDQLLAQKMQQEVNQKVRSTPAEVLEFYEATPKDSLPLIPEEISYSEIVIQPQILESQKQELRFHLDSIRRLVVEGKMSMTLAATRYSEDPGSKYKGGCYTDIRRGQFVPEFEEAVFDTPVGGYSGVFETDFGFHFLRVTDRRGEQFSACHVLMKPKVDINELEKNGLTIDSIYTSLKAETKTFDQVVLKYSTRESSANQRGQVVNPRDGGIKFGVDELDPNIYFVLSSLSEGEISEPMQLIDGDGNGYWTILKLDARHDAHRANPYDDYALFQSQVENEMRLEAMDKWVRKYIAQTFVRIDPSFDSCDFNMDWYEYIWSSQKEK